MGTEKAPKASGKAAKKEGSAPHTPKATGAGTEPDGPTAATGSFYEFFSDYGHQEILLNDQIRTGGYHKAIMNNAPSFAGKVVVDVGAGTGILSMFAARAGAKTVYAIEATKMAESAEELVKHNKLDHIVKVVMGKVEEVELPEKADILLGDCFGLWVVNEMMVQAYVIARDRFLKPGGMMLPSSVDIYTAPASLPAARQEALSQECGWLAKTPMEFYGLDFTLVDPYARGQGISKPVVDQIYPSDIMAPPCCTKVDFATVRVEELNNFALPVRFNSPRVVQWDSVAVWFDLEFAAPNPVAIRTGPHHPLTSWYHSAFLVRDPIPAESFDGCLSFDAEGERSYAIKLKGGPVITSSSKSRKRPQIEQSFQFTQATFRYFQHMTNLAWMPEYMTDHQKTWGYRQQQQQQHQHQHQTHPHVQLPPPPPGVHGGQGMGMAMGYPVSAPPMRGPQPGYENQQQGPPFMQQQMQVDEE